MNNKSSNTLKILKHRKDWRLVYFIMLYLDVLFQVRSLNSNYRFKFIYWMELRIAGTNVIYSINIKGYTFVFWNDCKICTIYRYLECIISRLSYIKRVLIEAGVEGFLFGWGCCLSGWAVMGMKLGRQIDLIAPNRTEFSFSFFF